MKVTPSWFFTQLQKSIGAKYRQRIPRGRQDIQIRKTRRGIILQGKPKDNKCRASEAQQLRRDLYCFCDALYRYMIQYKPIFLSEFINSLREQYKKQSARSIFMSLCLKGELYNIMLEWCNAEIIIDYCESYPGKILIFGHIDFKGEIPKDVEDVKRPNRMRP